MNQKEKIRQLFYSTDENNRTLAFELAEGANYYTDFIKEIYNLIFEVPFFMDQQTSYLENIQKIYAESKFKPTGIELKRELIEEFCFEYFDEDISLEGYNDSKLLTIPKIFLNCTFIKELDLSSHKITQIPDEISNLTQLELLDLSYNNIVGLPDSFSTLQQLHTLVLLENFAVFRSSNDLTDEDYSFELPSCIRQLKNLKHLNLGGVRLDSIPEWISELSHLEHFKLFSGYDEGFTLVLPPTFTQLSKLETLAILDYEVEIPNNIDQLQSLKKLVIRPVLNYPESIKQLKNLEYLDLSYFPSEFQIKEQNTTTTVWDFFNTDYDKNRSRLEIYGWEWLKEMTWLKELKFEHIEPYAFSDSEIAELQQALPNCILDIEES